MSTLKKFAGQTLIYGLSTIIARLFNFVLTPIFVKKYPTAVYGIFTTVYAWAAILNAIIAFGRVVGDGRYYAMLTDIVVDPDFQGQGLGKY